MIKEKNVIFFFVLATFLIIGCEELNSPDDYLMIPSQITIEKVEYDTDYNYYIYLNWRDYRSQHTGFQLTRDDITIAELSQNNYSYIDKIGSTGTYEYRLYAVNGTIVSSPSYIKIKLNRDTYEWWYE